MTKITDRIYAWGYVIDNVPTALPFVFGKTRCSLETEAEFLGVSKAFYNNSMFSREYYCERFSYMDTEEIVANCLDNRLSAQHMAYMEKIDEVFCTLEHDNYHASAIRIAELSLKFPNIKGIHFDDFTPAMGSCLAQIRDDIKAINPDLQIAAVTYADQHQPLDDFVRPFAQYIDLFSRWCWRPALHYWEHHAEDIARLRDAAGPGKQIIQGIYIHDFGSDMRNRHSVPMDVFRKSVETICESTYSGVLDGFIIPQAGWFCMGDKYEHIRFLKDYLNWFDGTTTVR